MNDNATKSGRPENMPQQSTDGKKSVSQRMPTLLESPLAIPARPKPKDSRLHLKGNRRRLLLIVIVVLVVTMGVIYWLDKSAEKQQILDEMEAVTQEASNLVTEYRYDEAIGVWQEFTSQPLGQDIKCEANLRFSNVYLESGKYSEANKRFLDVKNNCPKVDNYALHLGLARSYEGFGDITNSIDNYQKVIDIEKDRQQNPPKDFDKTQSEQNVERYTEIIEVLRLNL